jgi:hypothetical protein
MSYIFGDEELNKIAITETKNNQNKFRLIPFSSASINQEILNMKGKEIIGNYYVNFPLLIKSKININSSFEINSSRSEIIKNKEELVNNKISNWNKRLMKNLVTDSIIFLICSLIDEYDNINFDIDNFYEMFPDNEHELFYEKISTKKIFYNKLKNKFQSFNENKNIYVTNKYEKIYDEWNKLNILLIIELPERIINNLNFLIMNNSIRKVNDIEILEKIKYFYEIEEFENDYIINLWDYILNKNDIDNEIYKNLVLPINKETKILFHQNIYYTHDYQILIKIFENNKKILIIDLNIEFYQKHFEKLKEKNLITELNIEYLSYMINHYPFDNDKLLEYVLNKDYDKSMILK